MNKTMHGWRIAILVAAVAAGLELNAAEGRAENAVPPAPKYSPPASASVELNFNSGWRLAKGSHLSAVPPADRGRDADRGAAQAGPVAVDDSAWERVSAPHTYHEREGFLVEWESTPKDRGPFTYRKHFDIPAEWKGGKLYLEFQGIRQRGQFHLNGQLLGRHSNGVAPFGFDLTPHVLYGGRNTLHVEIDTEEEAHPPHKGRMPWASPHFNPLYGGIHRNVILRRVPKVHATLPLHSSFGTEGTYVYAENISTEKRSADIGIEVQVRNDETEPRAVTCRAVLVDMAGKAAAAFDCPSRRIEAGTNQTFVMSRPVEGLRFWQPGYPYLYDVYTIVSAGEGKPDVRRIRTGFRKIEARGPEFFVNNRLLMTHGYAPSTQNEWAAVGSAYPDWLHDHSIRLMVEGNTRMVRWMHCVPSAQDIHACDRAGLPQMTSFADHEGDSQGPIWDLRKEIARDVIVYFRNSPSIFLWESSNGRLSVQHCMEMIGLRDRWDARGSRRPMGGRSSGYCGPTEWKSDCFDRPRMVALAIDTEYMREESPRRWWDAWSPPYFHKNDDRWNYNQDNQCLCQVREYERYYAVRPGQGQQACHSGGLQIYFTDTDCGQRGIDPFRRSGPVDAMRIPKDAFFCYRTMWSNTPELWTEGTPSVFLPGHWNHPAGTVKPMYVFVSPGIDKVELSVNGESVPGNRLSRTFAFVFPDVVWKPGRVEARGFDAAGKQVAVAAHVTCGEPAALRMKAIQGPGGLRVDGSDLALIETEVVDKEGRRCPLAQNLVKYEVTGPAIWRGGFWEEDVGKYADKKEIPVLNGVHRVIVRSTEEPGTIEIAATAEGLTPASVEIGAGEVKIEGGLTLEMPASLPVVLGDPPPYGPDLPLLKTRVRRTSPERDNLQDGEMIRGLSTSFPHGARIVAKAADGAKVFADRPWVFENLPGYLVGAEYVQVHNEDASVMADDAVAFTLARAGRICVAYDDANKKPPLSAGYYESLLGGKSKTRDKIAIGGRPHTIWKSAAMVAGDWMYLASQNWWDPPPSNANNYVVFVTEGRSSRGRGPELPEIEQP